MSMDTHTDETLTMSIVEAVSSAEDRSVLELPPLNDAVDPDALAALFPETADRDRGAEEVSFEYSDSVVTVYGSGQVSIESGPDASS